MAFVFGGCYSYLLVDEEEREVVGRRRGVLACCNFRTTDGVVFPYIT